MREVAPILTIGLPVYNDVKFLELTLKNILNQTFTNFTLIISDDFSSDGSDKICLSYKEQDSRIVYFRQPKNVGISRNMGFLLRNADTKYFMWAGDDDIIQPEFIDVLIKKLDQNPDVVIAFTPTVDINEEGEIISSVSQFDYSGKNATERIKKLIIENNDSCGYGMFRRHKIVNVRFPVWAWPNNKTAYNNIFPTICHYLAIGDFALVGAKPLLYNRIKEGGNINHKMPYHYFLFRGWFALTLRKLNMILFSFWMIIKAKKRLTALIIFPRLIYYWFWKPVVSETKHRIKFYKSYKLI